jgi:lipoate-protein ligase A
MAAETDKTAPPARRARILRSVETDPVINLAIEEALYRNRKDHEILVLFYRNTPSIIIGRNQNPWSECDVSWSVEHDIPIVRRISGGGTVYHDLGNLNVSFIVPRHVYAPDLFMDVSRRALHRLSVPAKLCERRTIWLGDRKVAGSAFTLTGKSAILHQCMLVSTDLAPLSRALRPPARRIRGNTVHSVRSPVCTLRAAAPDVTVDAVTQACVDTIAETWEITGDSAIDAGAIRPEKTLSELRRKYASWDWTFGRTGEFTHVLKPSGQWEVILTVARGRVVHATMGRTGGDVRETTLWNQMPYDGRMLAEKLTSPCVGHDLDWCVGKDAVARNLEQEIPSGLRTVYP